MTEEEENSPRPKVNGRPTKYKEEYCQLIRNFMSGGMSIAACAAEIGVSRKILNDWANRHPNFRVACDAGKEDAQRWWEALAMGVATGANATHDVYKKANHGMIMFMMSRRFPDYYAKNRQITEDGNQSKLEEMAALTREERLILIGRYKQMIDELERDEGHEL
jgi:hypothetical protein